jgi:RHS repeat-associated protein
MVMWGTASFGPDGAAGGIQGIGHQGLLHDREFGLIYNRARMLHPTLARFPQRDPIGYAGGMSLYEYVGSSPAAALDPAGQAATTKPAFAKVVSYTILWYGQTEAWGWTDRDKFLPVFALKKRPFRGRWGVYLLQEAPVDPKNRNEFSAGRWICRAEAHYGCKNVNSDGQVMRLYKGQNTSAGELDKMVKPEKTDGNHCIECLVCNGHITVKSIDKTLAESVAWDAAKLVLPGAKGMTSMLTNMLKNKEIDLGKKKNPLIQFRGVICADGKRALAILNIPSARNAPFGHAPALSRWGAWIHTNLGGKDPGSRRIATRTGEVSHGMSKPQYVKPSWSFEGMWQVKVRGGAPSTS